jgi:hypothetical protein
MVFTIQEIWIVLYQGKLLSKGVSTRFCSSSRTFVKDEIFMDSKMEFVVDRGALVQ